MGTVNLQDKREKKEKETGEDAESSKIRYRVCSNEMKLTVSVLCLHFLSSMNIV